MNLLLTAGFILFLLWLVGIITTYTFGGGIHLLLVLAVISIIVSLIIGRR